MLSGSGTGFINDSEFDMAEGDVMHVEKNEFHGLINNSDTDEMKSALRQLAKQYRDVGLTTSTLSIVCVQS